jgi:hypothetical protein
LCNAAKRFFAGSDKMRGTSTRPQALRKNLSPFSLLQAGPVFGAPQQE